MKLTITLALSLLAMPWAVADCNQNKTLFQCTTTNNKVLEVCYGANTIGYSFGKPNQTPELAINVPKSAAEHTPWSGIGRYINESIDIPNGDVVYAVYYSLNKLDEKQKADAGVAIMKKSKTLATVKCNDKKPIVNNIGNFAE